MAVFTWIGSDGDWDDQANWNLDSIPMPQDLVEFNSTLAATLEGAAYIGQLELSGSDLTVSGDFSPDGVDAAEIVDMSGTDPAATLTIQAWGALQLDDLSLSTTSIVDLGLLVTQSATVTNGIVEGTDADWFGKGTAIFGTLAVLGGGTLTGNLSLANGATIVTDANSNILGGSITVELKASLLLSQALSSGDTVFSIDDDIYLNPASTLNIVGNSSQEVKLNGTVSGPGTLAILGATLVVANLAVDATDGLRSSISSRPENGSEAPAVAGGSTFELSSSVLDLRQSSPTDAVSTILCSGDVDAIFGGSQAFSVVSGGASLIDVQAGAGENTVAAGASALSYVQGSGSASVVCGSSGGDTIEVGSGDAVVQASNGADIQVTGGGAVTVAASSGSCGVDDRSGTGSLTVYGKQSLAVMSILAGSGALSVYASAGAFSIVGGTGELTAWCGPGGDDTLIGGTGPETLVGGADAFVIASGGSAGVYGTSASNATINASTSSGNDTIFATSGAGTTQLLGGTGSDVFLGGTGTDYIRCGSGFDYVWADAGNGNTVQGGSGGDVIAGGISSVVKLVGSSNNVVISNGGQTIVDQSSAMGSLTVFASGSGLTSVIGGAGGIDALVDHTELDVNGGYGACVIWCTNGASLNLLGAAPVVVIAEGSDCSINASGSSGNDTFFIGACSNASLNLGSGASYVIGGQAASTVDVSAGLNTIFAGSGTMNINFSVPTDVFEQTTIVGYDVAVDDLSFAAAADLSTTQTQWGDVLSAGNQTVILYDYFGSVSTTIGR